MRLTAERRSRYLILRRLIYEDEIDLTHEKVISAVVHELRRVPAGELSQQPLAPDQDKISDL